MTVTETRRNNLRALIEKHGGVAKLSRKMGYANASFLSQMAGPNPSRDITEKTARKLEQTMGIPKGTLDLDAQTVVTAPTPTRNSDEITTLVASVIHMVGSACEAENVTPSPSKFADVVTLVLLDTADKGTAPQEDRVRQIARLLK